MTRRRLGVQIPLRPLCLRPIWIAALGCGPSSLRRVRFRYRQTPHLESPRFGGGFRVDTTVLTCYDAYMDIIRRLASSQARGHRQQSFVNELLSFREVPYRRYSPTVHVETLVFGESRLSYQSWRSLRARMVSVGFVVVDDKDTCTVRISFPEYGA